MQLNRTLRPAISALGISTRPLPTFLLMIGSDLLALGLAGVLSIYSRLWLFEEQFNPSLYWQLTPGLGLFIATYAIMGLYPGVAISPVDELRWTSLSTTLMYLTLTAMLLLGRDGEVYDRGVFVLSWLLSIVLVLVGRALVRSLFAHRRWWGYPVIVLGAGKTGDMVIRTLRHRPSIGLKPVLVLDDNPDKHGVLQGIPVVGGVALAPKLARRRNIPYAIVAMPGVPRDRLLTLIERYGTAFPHLLIIPDLFEFSSLWVSAKDMGGILGLEVRQTLLLPGPRLAKFLIDLVATLIGGLVILPLIGVIALLIRLDSPGPIFYSQLRIGQNGQHFKAWKFRTMIRNADEALQAYLDRHPDLREAWERDQKLRRDPRITRIGGFLRRTSLDELPQLWNVLRGEMSLVGPRPIVDEEVQKYGNKFELYKKVLPGLTGLWQISGRNNITYEERVSLDAYYVRNWSVWLDVYILLRTIWVVVKGEGAY
ncbi:undecaprenyl-phosphate galactose phosphotransferase WbaP [Thermocoleostomius sinensis]|uniref:Undecaprenyl-phosphate galactose phosphotransferase WbaP n=1 Tax=Thermocoleostomius sinensis A174 TaxID=2016057 RepID=A0A9E8ZHT1_9CYAN|nr:undecaprenyl-phosphate galactose phosphotransferase WbaP [Thermocoleostomius sinensis]WAL61977.1 undecaprenyl-phosphate galactose phosphotransferase WbaP [Thermocoleostomius sinensis A174]